MSQASQDTAAIVSQLSEKRESLKTLIMNANQNFQKKSVRTVVKDIAQLTNQYKSEERPLGLKYILGLGDLLSSIVLANLKANPDFLEAVDVKELFTALFKSFTVYEVRNQHKEVEALENELLARIQDRTSFICSLLQEYLF